MDYILYNYNIKVNSLIKDYNNNYSLPELRQKYYGIDFKSIVFILKHKGVNIRTIKTATNLKKCRDKYKETCLRKYGEENVLTKGTSPYRKKIKTLKERYGNPNLFNLKNIQDRLRSDETYMERYGMTFSEYNSYRMKKVWENLSEEGKEEWMNRSLFSKKAIEK